MEAHERLGNMISQDSLPGSLVPFCLDILRKLSSGERDLIRIVVEVIHELRDDLNEDDFVSFHSSRMIRY